MVARYEGEPLVKLLPDGRNVELVADMVFIDPQDVRWAVPAGATVDGASIPRAFWPVVGGPFEGRYRDASIIHDWFCDRRTRTWQATHRVFYDAMLVSGVSVPKAKLMYFGVYWAGPRWEERVTLNTRLPVDTSYHFYRPSRLSVNIVRIPSPGSFSHTARQSSIRDDLEVKIASLDLEEIERLAESVGDGTHQPSP